MCSVNNGNSVIDSTLVGAAVGNNNTITNNITIATSSLQFSKQEQHDIDALERLLSDIPRNFQEQLDLILLSHRRYKVSETRYIAYFEDKTNDPNNYLINQELQSLVSELKDKFSDLYYEMASRFVPDDRDLDYQILPRPYDYNKEAMDQYYHALQNELPNAIKAAHDAYLNVCHKRTELFGI